jgi:flavin-binding protein dodecin
MGDDTYEGSAHDRPVVVGRSEVSFDDALKAAVAKAVELGFASVDDEVTVLEQSVKIANPKIGEYIITVRPEPGG